MIWNKFKAGDQSTQDVERSSKSPEDNQELINKPRLWNHTSSASMSPFRITSGRCRKSKTHRFRSQLRRQIYQWLLVCRDANPFRNLSYNVMNVEMIQKKIAINGLISSTRHQKMYQKEQYRDNDILSHHNGLLSCMPTACGRSHTMFQSWFTSREIER